MSRRRLYWFFAVNYFAQGMAGLAYEPVAYFLKDRLGLGPGACAGFIAWMTLPLAVKPVFGLLTDLVPWGGRRRVPHLIAAALLTSGAWLSLAALPRPGYAAALALLLLVNVGFVSSDIVCDAVMVERGRESGDTGRFQAAQLATLYVTIALTGFGGGWLSAAPRRAFALAALFPLLTAAAALLVEEPAQARLRETAAKGLAGLASFARDRRALALALGVFLWTFAPFLGTAQFFYQSEHLKLSPVFIGGLATAEGVAGALGALLYGRLSPDAARAARWSIALGAPLSLLWVFYAGPASALALTVLFGATGVAFRLAWMTLAAEACPGGAEGTVFAAYMAVFSIAQSASNWAGGALYERLAASRGPYAAMVLLSLAATAATLAAWPFLKAATAPRAA